MRGLGRGQRCGIRRGSGIEVMILGFGIRFMDGMERRGGWVLGGLFEWKLLAAWLPGCVCVGVSCSGVVFNKDQRESVWRRTGVGKSIPSSVHSQMR